MRKRVFLLIALAVLIMISMVYAQSGNSENEEVDPVLRFYVNQADSVFRQTYFSDSLIHYSFVAFTYYKSIGRHGAVSRLDSAVTRYFCSGSRVDSTVVMSEPQRSMPEITIVYPDVFTENYQHKFFPNDIGESDLAIGFDIPETDDTLPNGIAVIDRESYVLRRLYLYYPNQKNYKRLTRSFRMSEYSGLVFPDSIWEVGAKQGIFTTEYYRLETEIGQFQLTR